MRGLDGLLGLRVCVWTRAKVKVACVGGPRLRKGQFQSQRLNCTNGRGDSQPPLFPRPWDLEASNKNRTLTYKRIKVFMNQELTISAER